MSSASSRSVMPVSSRRWEDHVLIRADDRTFTHHTPVVPVYPTISADPRFSADWPPLTAAFSAVDTRADTATCSLTTGTPAPYDIRTSPITGATAAVVLPRRLPVQARHRPGPKPRSERPTAWTALDSAFGRPCLYGVFCVHCGSCKWLGAADVSYCQRCETLTETSRLDWRVCRMDCTAPTNDGRCEYHTLPAHQPTGHGRCCWYHRLHTVRQNPVA